ncbi:cysteine proteinase inhibitor 1-like [Wolffia australiana]
MATSPRRFLCLSLLLGVLLALPNSNNAAKKAGIVGGFHPLPDAENALIQDLARYAVSQYTSETGESLTLTRVLDGQYQQIAPGKTYRLVIGAAPLSAVESLYLATVFESWNNFRELRGFKLIVQPSKIFDNSSIEARVAKESSKFFGVGGKQKVLDPFHLGLVHFKSTAAD